MDAYEFDSINSMWSKLEHVGDIPKPRDDHSLSQIDDKSFLIFGGFVAGSRTNDCYVCCKKGRSLEWKRLGDESPEKPCARASHSSVIYNNKCYIFGGHDEDNNKFGDLWELDLTSGTYKDISAKEGFCSARSGHSANIFNGKMYVFGGIVELTKELNELLIYDFATAQFSVCDYHNEDIAHL